MKKVILLLTVFASVVLFNQCASTSPQSVDQTSVKFVITDALRRDIALPQPANQVIGTDFATLNTAVVLGGGSGLLVGCGNKQIANRLYSLVMDYESVIQIGDGATVQYEKVKTLGKNIVAIVPEKYQDQVRSFEVIGIPALVTLSRNENFESVKNALSIVGKTLGEEFRADLITQFFDLQLVRANQINITQKANKQTRVVVLGISSPLSVVANDSIHSLIIRTVGAVNVAESISPNQTETITLQQLMEWDPEVILIPSQAEYTVATILKDPAWGSLQAVKNQKVFQFPSALEPWDFPTPAVCLGVNWAVHVLYPKALVEMDMMRHIHEYYTMVYGQTFTDEQLGLP